MWRELGSFQWTSYESGSFKAAVLTSLLFGSETWELYRRHMRKLEQFHMRCLRRIAHVRWQDKRPNTEVLQMCNISGIEALLIAAQFRCTSHVTHVIRMSNDRLPKIIFYSELKDGARAHGGSRYKLCPTFKHNAAINAVNNFAVG